MVGSPIKDKGNIWINETTKHDALVIMGSSELSSPVSQNIKNNFPNEKYTGTTSLLGHAHVQNGLHAMNLGANYKSFKDSDIVIIESIQWFFGNDIDADGFMSNFSEIQFYEFLHNDLISRENKEYLSQRFLEMEKKRTTLKTPEQLTELAGDNQAVNAFGLTPTLARKGWLEVADTSYDFPQTHILAELYSADGLWDKVLYQVMRPYYFVRYQLMSLQDRYETLNAFTKTEEVTKEVFTADWEAQLANAEMQGKEASTNNEIFVYDDYFTSYLADGWESKKNISAGTSALDSKEWNDYRFLLSVCNELGLKPYIINVSSNGYYYDYVGIDPKMRQEYYTKNNKTAIEYGIPVYSELAGKEYEPYVFADVMHLGWKGWIYVTKAITEHFQ